MMRCGTLFSSRKGRDFVALWQCRSIIALSCLFNSANRAAPARASPSPQQRPARSRARKNTDAEEYPKQEACRIIRIDT